MSKIALREWRDNSEPREKRLMWSRRRFYENNAIAKVKQEFEMRRQQETLIHGAAVQSLENRKTACQGLDKDGKANAFVKAVSSPGEMITFWSFFEYMKTRTD